MVQADTTAEQASRQGFAEHERTVRIQNYRTACIVALVFMPAGVSLDYLMYDKKVGRFFCLRLCCSALLLFIWWLVKTPFGARYYQWLGLILPALPSFFISWMIYETTGALSPYYAGLNLVLLGAALILRWSLWESVFVFLEVLATYLAACLLHGWDYQKDKVWAAVFFNNIYFLIVTGVFVVIGSHFYNRLRWREYSLRFQLDQNRRELEQNNQRLIELDQVKSRFFANISHELRTPLTLLLAPLETLIQRTARSWDDASRDLLGTMRSNGMRLLKLINDLLDLVRLESGRMEVKKSPLEIDHFIKGLVSAARQVADDKRIRLEAQVDSNLQPVLVDGDKLEKVVLNLLFNALKFTPSGGRVEVRAEKQENHLILTVSDTGMGIAAASLPYIFDRFWQADTSSKRKYQGVGIGLALVKEFVELQAGTVNVKSQEGQGTTFTIRLPFEPAELNQAHPSDSPAGEDGVIAEKPPDTSSEEWLANLYRRAELFPAITPIQESLRPVETWSTGKRSRILIADDEADMLRFLKSQLSTAYEVLEAVDGQQAVEKACQFLPDIILLDMMMPGKNGIEACQELRERTPTQSIPVLLLTARADEETKLSALKAGASDFLPKPFSITELHVRIKNLAESYEYQRKLSKQNQVLERTIEQLKETESQLVESEKMRSLGQLSAGMIHEINNPLNYATTGLYTLRQKSGSVGESERPEYLEILGEVEEGVKRVKDLVSKMREFSYADNKEMAQVEVAQVVTSALRFLGPQWKDKVEVHQNIPEGQTISGNKNRMIQVLLNLLQNSVDALSRKTAAGEKPQIWIEGQVDSDRSVLLVRDNGSGIDPEHLDKIFDPFFTTKDVGEGMGLGLSICYRIVQDCGGRITVKSEPGQSCEFRLEFPVKHATPAAAAA
ncbi:MAG: ATP-binding protein [Verrucomicrobiota bacterium]